MVRNRNHPPNESRVPAGVICRGGRTRAGSGSPRGISKLSDPSRCLIAPMIEDRAEKEGAQKIKTGAT